MLPKGAIVETGGYQRGQICWQQLRRGRMLILAVTGGFDASEDFGGGSIASIGLFLRLQRRGATLGLRYVSSGLFASTRLTVCFEGLSSCYQVSPANKPDRRALPDGATRFWIAVSTILQARQQSRAISPKSTIPLCARLVRSLKNVGSDDPTF